MVMIKYDLILKYLFLLNLTFPLITPIYKIKTAGIMCLSNANPVITIHNGSVVVQTTYTFPSPITSFGALDPGLVMGDIDNDGYPDILSRVMNSGNSYFYLLCADYGGFKISPFADDVNG